MLSQTNSADIIIDKWSYINGKFVDGDNVQVAIHPFPAQNKTIVQIHLKGEHGWTVAESDYFYVITDGAAIFSLEGGESVVCVNGESILVHAGTPYSYRPEQPGDIVEATLFMNHLWSGE